MRELGRLMALGLVFCTASAMWLVLAGVMTARTSSQQAGLYGRVADLWGTPLDQGAPTASFHWIEDVPREEVVRDNYGNVERQRDGSPLTRTVIDHVPRDEAERLASTALTVDLGLDQRRKGLMWFSLYDVDFDGIWTVAHAGPQTGTLNFDFTFPAADGMYDDFRVTVDGQERTDVVPAFGHVSVPVDVKPGDTVTFEVHYRSRGMDQFVYRPVPMGQVGQIDNFALAMTTDFAAIDFPTYTMSPSARETSGTGWKLDWSFRRLVTGSGMGMEMPQRIQPGPLAAEMSASAPISLGLFMLWIYVIGLLKKVDIHPMNHMFVAGAFFAFHLLFGYTADHLPVEWAFGLSSVVSVFLVVTYLRLAVGAKFAIREAGLAQLVYLVGFSFAHFFDGFTGLTVTILGVATLFALMQLTGRVKWTEVFAGAPPASPLPKIAAPPAPAT